MAAPARHRSPQRHRGPIPAGAGGKIDKSRLGRLRRRCPCAVGGRRRTPTRRPPRGSPLVAHPRSATPQMPSQDPTTPNTVPSTRRTTTTSHDQQPPRPPLGTASRGRPESLNLASRPTTTPEMCFGGLSPNPLISTKRPRLPSAPRVVAALRAATRRLRGGGHIPSVFCGGADAQTAHGLALSGRGEPLLRHG
jgi:hypothetical protein